MKKTQTFLLTALAALMAAPASAAFVDDAQSRVELRNFYFNRDFRQSGAAQSKADEWAQGFMLNFESGYTDGTVGFGLDALGMLGIKLDSSPDRTGTGLLPPHDDGRAADEYSKLGLTAKMRYSESELFLGTLMPKLPILQPNTSRILPQTFRGGMATINEFDNLSIDFGRLTKATDRDSTDAEDLALNNKNRRFGGSFSADQLDWAGLNYQFNSSLAASYYLAQLDDIYRQHFFGLNHSAALGAGELSTELRVAVSDEQGAAQAGRIDNQAWQGRIGYALNGHEVSAAAQKMRGDSAFPYIDGSNPYLVNFVQINDFANADERSWQARYDYNFAAMGVPGLTATVRYITGNNVDTGLGYEGRDRERDLDIGYAVQSGALKGLGIRVRNAMARSNYRSDIDENRLTLVYTWQLF